MMHFRETNTNVVLAWQGCNLAPRETKRSGLLQLGVYTLNVRQPGRLEEPPEGTVLSSL